MKTITYLTKTLESALPIRVKQYEVHAESEHQYVIHTREFGFEAIQKSEDSPYGPANCIVGKFHQIKDTVLGTIIYHYSEKPVEEAKADMVEYLKTLTEEV